MKHLLSGIVCSSTVLLSGCLSHEVDYRFTETNVYKNNTSVIVTIEACRNDELAESFTIGSGAFLEQVGTFGVGGPQGDRLIVHTFETIRIVFGNTREMWFDIKKNQTAPYSLFDFNNYTKTEVAMRHSRYEFDISEEMMNAATAIKPAR